MNYLNMDRVKIRSNPVAWQSPKIEFNKIRDTKSPERAHSTDAGIDWFVPNDFEQIKLEIGQSILIPSGIRVIIPEGFMLMAANKSGIATKKGIVIGAAIVDEMYRNELHIHLIKVANASSPEHEYISAGDKIAQFILVPVNYATPIEISNSEYNDIISTDNENDRGTGGFGSTNSK